MSDECSSENEKKRGDNLNTFNVGSTVSGVSGAISEVIRLSAAHPKFKQAADNIGQTVVTVSETINNFLMPLAAINFACHKARIYFRDKFPEDISEKLASVANENIIAPKSSIAGPVLQGLAFCHEEFDLKEMYLNLLKSSMDSEVAESAHPAFVEIIKQLTTNEAILLKGLLSDNEWDQPIVEIRQFSRSVDSWITLSRHVMNLSTPDGELVYVPYLESWIDNWSRLGLVNADYSSRLVDHSYEWIYERDDFKNYKRLHENESYIVNYSAGMLRVTGFGRSFAKAVGF